MAQDGSGLIAMIANDQSSMGELLKFVPAALFRQAADGTLLDLSAGFEHLTGITVSAALKDASLLSRIVHLSDAEAFQKRASQGGTAEAGWTFRIWHARTGELKTIQELREPLEAGASRGFWIDKTDWALVGKRLQVGAWKEALSKITFGIAHDFNNALTGLNGMSDLLLAQTEAKHPFREPLMVIQQSVKKANELVRRLNDLHQSGPGRPEYCDLGQITARVLDFLHKVIPSHVKVKQLLDPAPLPVFADLWRVRLVLVQLLMNAFEAVKEPGTVEVQTSRQEEAPHGAPVFGVLADGPWVRVRIEGGGNGFAQEVAGLVPWQTSKVSAHGAGLGLFVVRKFCLETGAALFVTASSTRGTVAELWMHRSSLAEAEALLGAQKRLLIAGSDGTLIRNLASLCKGSGYSAILSPDLGAVIRILAVNAEEFDAVVLEGNAKECQPIFDWIRSEKLPLKVILLTDPEKAPESDLVMAYSDSETFLRRLKILLS